MGQQRTFASVAWSQKGKVTRRERFLAEMDAVIPWTRLFRRLLSRSARAERGLPTEGVREREAKMRAGPAGVGGNRNVGQKGPLWA